MVYLAAYLCSVTRNSRTPQWHRKVAPNYFITKGSEQDLEMCFTDSVPSKNQRTLKTGSIWSWNVLDGQGVKGTSPGSTIQGFQGSTACPSAWTPLRRWKVVVLADALGMSTQLGGVRCYMLLQCQMLHEHANLIFNIIIDFNR